MCCSPRLRSRVTRAYATRWLPLQFPLSLVYRGGGRADVVLSGTIRQQASKRHGDKNHYYGNQMSDCQCVTKKRSPPHSDRFFSWPAIGRWHETAISWLFTGLWSSVMLSFSLCRLARFDAEKCWTCMRLIIGRNGIAVSVNLPNAR